MISTNSDAVICSYKRFKAEIPENEENEDYKKLYSANSEITESLVLSKTELLPLEKKAQKQTLNFIFVSVLYKTDLIKRKNISFLNISHGEDTFFLIKYLLNSERVFCSDRVVYHYRLNTQSVSFRYHTNFIENTQRYYEAYSQLFSAFSSAIYEKAMEGILANCFLRCIDQIDRELSIDVSKRTFGEMYKNIKEISNSPFFRQMYQRGKSYLYCISLKIEAELIYYRFYALAVVISKVRNKCRRITA